MTIFCNATLRPQWHFSGDYKYRFVDGVNQPAKKNILSIANIVTFEATHKFWGMEDWRKCCMERTRWTISKSFPAGVDVMSRCSFPIYFCASTSSCCCIVVASSPSLMIIFSFSYIFCTSSSSSRCSAKVIWVSLEIAVLSSCGIEMEIAAYHPWRELIYHLFRTDFLQSIFDLILSVRFKKLSSWCSNNAAIGSSLSVAGEHPYVPSYPDSVPRLLHVDAFPRRYEYLWI